MRQFMECSRRAAAVGPILTALCILNATSVQAMCFNPFGCEPKSESECINNAAKDAKTENAAKVLIQECRERFSVTSTMCSEDAKIFRVESNSSPKLEEIRKKMPSLSGLDDQSALDVIHQAYYPDQDKTELGKLIGITYAPNRTLCKKYYKDYYK